MMILRKFMASVAFLGVMLMAGCTSQSPEDALTNVLGEMYEAEEGYRNHQEKLNQLEKDEQQLFDRTVDLSDDKQDEIKQNIDKLQSLLKERQEKLAEENEAMRNAEKLIEDFEKVEADISEEQEETVSQLKEVIIQRYDAHKALIEEYETLMDAQKKLYEMLAKEQTDIVEVEELVHNVNTQNEAVVKAVEQFNGLTIQLNEQQESLSQQDEQQE